MTERGISAILHNTACIHWLLVLAHATCVGGSKVRGGKMRGTVRGINASRWVICEAGMCEAQRITGTAGVGLGYEPLKRN